MKTKKDFIKTISIVRGNLSHIESTGNINGTLLIEIERVMEEYAQQQVKNLNIPAVMGELTCDSCGCHPNVIYTTSKGRLPIAPEWN